MYESTLKKAQCVRFAGWFLAKNAVLTLSETIWGSSIETDRFDRFYNDYF